MAASRKYLEWERLTDSGVRVVSKLPKSKPEAVKAGASHYYTGVPCKHGHMVVRSIAVAGCPRCNQFRFRGEPLDSRPPRMVYVFHQHINLNNRQLGFRSPEGHVIEE